MIEDAIGATHGKLFGRIIGTASITITCLITGCTSYKPRPILDTPVLAPSIEQGLEAAVAPDSEGHYTYSFDLSDGLNLTEIGIIAVLNNPELQAGRTREAVAQAQVFSAGLLPDPKLTAAVDRPDKSADDLVNAWLFGLDYEISALIVRNARIDEARAARDKVNLEVLWQEWQVAQKARMLAVSLQIEERQLDILGKIKARYLTRYKHSSEALQRHDTTLDVAGTDLVAVVDTISRISTLKQSHNQTQHDFNILLGLDPQARVPISPLLPPDYLDRQIAEGYLSQITSTRPDLLSLAAGYASQEARVRAAVLAQYPALSIGINRARDTSDIVTGGMSVSLSLPFFNGNRGQIAVERATRSQLREEYRSRVAQATTDVDRLLDLQEILQRQQDQLQQFLPSLEAHFRSASVAYDNGDISALAFLKIESTWVNKKLEELEVTRVQWENRIALEALLAMPAYSAPGIPTMEATK